MEGWGGGPRALWERSSGRSAASAATASGPSCSVSRLLIAPHHRQVAMVKTIATATTN